MHARGDRAAHVGGAGRDAQAGQDELKDKLRSLRTRHESGRTERDRELAALRRESDVKERPAQ